MSEPIIIETPAPPTRERLVLVRERIIVPESRDATPADLERAGWVTGEMLAEQVRIVWAAGQKAEPVGVAMLRKLKDRAEKAENCGQDDVCATPPGCQRHWEEQAREAIARAEKAERERDELRAELARLTAPRLRFDYVRGRPIKVDLDGDTMNARLYDRDAGEGEAARIVDELRKAGGK